MRLYDIIEIPRNTIPGNHYKIFPEIVINFRIITENNNHIVRFSTLLPFTRNDVDYLYTLDKYYNKNYIGSINIFIGESFEDFIKLSQRIISNFVVEGCDKLDPDGIMFGKGNRVPIYKYIN